METTRVRSSDRNADSRSLQATVRNSCAKVEDCIGESPQSAMLLSLAAGLGVGLIVGLAVGGSRQSTSRWFDRRAAEQLGYRMKDSIGQLIPDALSKHLNS